MRAGELTARILPAAEWNKLAQTAMCLPLVRPAVTDGDVIVVERAGRIVGCWALLSCLHAEGLWIDPTERQRGSTGRKLLRAVRDAASGRGVDAAWITSMDPAVDRLARKRGWEVEGRHFIVPFPVR